MIWELAPSRTRVLGLMLAYVLGCLRRRVRTPSWCSGRRRRITKRFAAGGGDSNDLAMTLALALPMAWYLGIVYREPLLRWICRGYLPVAAVALGLTGSRGGMLATMVALLHRAAEHDQAVARPAGDRPSSCWAFPARWRSRIRPGDPHAAAGHHRD